MGKSRIMYVQCPRLWRRYLTSQQPIFLRVCHSPWRFIGQGSLVSFRAFIVLYLTIVGGMLGHYKRDKQIHILGEGEEGDEKPYSNWESVFQFSTIAFLLLWLYHFISFVGAPCKGVDTKLTALQCWSFTHLYYPDREEEDNHSWEAILLNKMSPPGQSIHSSKRLYFSLFYAVVHVFVLMNALIYWFVLVPKGKAQWPGNHYGHHHGDQHGGDGHDGDGHESEEHGGKWNYTMPSCKSATPLPGTHLTMPGDDLFGHGWFVPFCITNLWGVTAMFGLLEVFFLNSIKPQTVSRRSVC